MLPFFPKFSFPPVWSPCQWVLTRKRTGSGVTFRIAGSIWTVSQSSWALAEVPKRATGAMRKQAIRCMGLLWFPGTISRPALAGHLRRRPSKIAAVEVLILEGNGEAFNFGQSKSPDGELPKFTVTELRRVIDFAGGRWRQEARRR